MMIHSHRKDTYRDDPVRRSRLLSRILDPEYIGQSPSNFGSLFRARSPSLPQASVFVDRWGEEHDPDFRPFGSHPVVTPAAEEYQSWPWDEDEDEPRSTAGSTSPRSNRMSHSNSMSTTGSLYRFSQSPGTRSGSTSVQSSPPLEPDKPTQPLGGDGRRHIAPPAHIPRSALYPWTPAQRAARIPHEGNRRGIPPPMFIEEEHEDTPLSLVDSSYVPGYGHFAVPPSAQRPQMAPEAGKDGEAKKCGRARAHTVPTTSGSQLSEDEPPSPSYSHSLRQSVYLLGLKTKLGLYHMKARVRKASNAAWHPLSL